MEGIVGDREINAVEVIDQDTDSKKQADPPAATGYEEVHGRLWGQRRSVHRKLGEAALHYVSWLERSLPGFATW